MNNINIDNLFPKKGKHRTRTISRPISVDSLYHPVEKHKGGYIDFSVDQLLYEQDEKKQKIKNEYKKIFNLCLKKIKIANKLDERDLIYNVPESVSLCSGYNPIGSNKVQYSDFRIIAATNKNLIEQVNKGLMREDFFYRINVIPFTVPPLRERKEDISLLVEHFLELYSDRKDRQRFCRL